jgi:hypothetical protein
VLALAIVAFNRLLYCLLAVLAAIELAFRHSAGASGIAALGPFSHFVYCWDPFSVYKFTQAASATKRLPAPFEQSSE